MALSVEEKRLELLARIDQSKTQTERNRLGQFATPPALAQEIVSEGLSFLSESEPIRFLEPGFGTGPFYSALSSQVPASRMRAAVGYEVDSVYAQPVSSFWKGSKLRLELSDFTRAAPPTADSERFNVIISNPPYVRHHHLDADQKQRLQADVVRQTGIQMNGLAGLYAYFMLLSQAWMSRGGVGAWLIPSEFMDVNYGRQVKQFLLERVTLHRIHRFDPAEVQFGDALVSSAVVLFKNETPKPVHKPIFSFGGTLSKPKHCAALTHDQLRHVKKWTSLPHHYVHGRRKPANTLADLFKIKRGVATGHNSFFVLPRKRLEALDLPKRFLKPILPSPRDLKVNEILADERGEPLIDERRYLLVCNLPEAIVQTEYPELWRYLENGKNERIHERYLCRHRDPWYSQEIRPPAPLLCTYMGRHTIAGRHPFRFLLNHSNATAANVYLMLYPKPVLEHVLEGRPELRRVVWEALSAITPEMLLGEGRVYGGGLHKMEPSELASVPAEVVLQALPVLKLPKRQSELFS